jgi:DNA-binding protein H-NS
MAKRARPASRKNTVKATTKKAAPKMSAPRSDLDKLVASLEGLSVAGLRRVMTSCEKLLEKKTEGERKSFMEEMTARAAGLGMSITDLLKRAVPDSVMPSRAVANKTAGGKRASPGVKYRGPNGEEWSGRGRPAKWITELEAAGKKREDFAV